MTPIEDLPWQEPNATEAIAAERMRACGPSMGQAYIAFPWATWIDRLRRGLPPSSSPLQGLSGSSSTGPGIRATACQHVCALDHLELFRQAGITDLFWSHATTDLQRVAGMRIHPFPLYPVRCATHPPAGELPAPWERPLLYSFQGAYQPGLYRTPVRHWILQLPARDDACLQRRKEWHYEQAVYREQVLGHAPDVARATQLAAEASAYAETLQSSCFALCPSGSGPNSIRLWEALGYGAIPVILSDQLQLPGDAEMWEKAALFVPETQAAVAALPGQLEVLAADHQSLVAMQAAGQQIWQRYGLGGFVTDVLALLQEPHTVLLSRARQRCGRDPAVLQAHRPGELPLLVRRYLHEDFTREQPLLIQILNQGPAALLELRWKAALRISAQLLEGRPWTISSTSPDIEDLNALRYYQE